MVADKRCALKVKAHILKGMLPLGMQRLLFKRGSNAWRDVKMVAQIVFSLLCGGRQKMCLESKGPYSQGDASTGHAESSYKKGQQCME